MASRADATPEEQDGHCTGLPAWDYFFVSMGQPKQALDISPALERFKQVKAQNILYEKQQTVGRQDDTAEVSHLQDL